jgi:branched-chain amino acid transport system ATP-binding protein
MEALKVDGLSKNFGGLAVLQDLSFSLEVGEHTAIVGPNGAGKTTLLNLLTGEVSPTAGRVYIWGREVTTMPTHRRIHLGLARSLQIPILFSTLTVLTTVSLAVQGTKRSRFRFYRPLSAYHDVFARSQKLLEMVDLWDRRDDFVQALSHGELRRMEIALSLASEPRLILMDEPSAGLTRAETDALVSMIQDLAKDTTVLLVAHDMDMVFGVADRIMVLYFGKIIAQGSPNEIQADSRVKEIYLGTDEGAANVGVD